MGFKPGSDELSDLDVDSGTLSVDETNNRVGVGTTSPKTALTVEGTITLKEQADADSDTAAYGQIWVNTATPCELYFTDDAGTDTQLGTGGGSARTVAGDTDNGLITWVTSDNTFAAESTITYDGTTLAAELATFSGSRGIFTMDLQCYGDVKTSGSLVGANLGTTGAATSSLGMNAHADPTSLKSATGGGQVVTFGTEDGSDTLAAGKLMCLQDDGVWNYADADVVASSSALIGIALGTTTGNGILLQGFYHCASVQGSFVGGQPCYVSENAGDIDFTAPSSAGQVVRVVGYGTDVTNVIYFNPTGDWVELG